MLINILISFTHFLVIKSKLTYLIALIELLVITYFYVNIFKWVNILLFKENCEISSNCKIKKKNIIKGDFKLPTVNRNLAQEVTEQIWEIPWPIGTWENLLERNEVRLPTLEIELPSNSCQFVYNQLYTNDLFVFTCCNHTASEICGL